MTGGEWGIVLTGGASPAKHYVVSFLDRSALCVAADSGLDLAIDYGVEPDFIVGDMDSVVRKDHLARFSNDRVIRHGTKKDDTDTELGIELLREKGISRIAIIGGGGGRLDHTIALLALFDRPFTPKMWVSDAAFVHIIDDTLRMTKCEGRRISFFPVGEDTVTMRSDGLEWELNGLRWNHGSIGISNRIQKDPMTVEVLTGKIIMVGELEVLAGVANEQ